MKPLTLPVIILLFVLCSCERKPIHAVQSPKHEVPKPLQDDNKEFSLITKRGGDNLVEAIYADLVKKNADLKELEEQMAHFNEGRADSLKQFNEYDSKSDGYYTSAMETLGNIKDTVLKQRLRMLLAGSRKNYESKTARLKSLMKKIELDQVAIPDYYLTLKIAATLPVLEEYQNDNFPDGKSIIAITGESEKVRQQTQKLAEKYENNAVKK
ncbi:MAG TPA: hypothetical protein VFE54_00760 [Mucilaginibacter sp.]|jgi:hypothetical protein|nr:hypothetical protein [Mucilaginibacter sp.]